MLFRAVIISDKYKCVNGWIQSSGLASQFLVRHFSGAKSFIDSGNEQVDVIYIIRDEPPKPMIAVLRKQFPKARIIIISGNNRKTAVIGALEAGADGYILKTTSQEDANYLLRQLLHKGRVISPELIHMLVEHIQQKKRKTTLQEVPPLEWQGDFPDYETEHFQFINPTRIS